MYEFINTSDEPWEYEYEDGILTVNPGSNCFVDETNTGMLEVARGSQLLEEVK